MYLEMSRDEAHGGEGWAFPDCVWAPSAKKKGKGTWPFWSKVLAIRKGDVVLHLRGVTPNANFVGYSIAASDGFETELRPPDPKEWAFAKTFLRANLENFTQFHNPINLVDVFAARQQELDDYFERNKRREKSQKLNLFYVKQAGRLQCLNGAYLADIDEELFSALFSVAAPSADGSNQSPYLSIRTSWQLKSIKTRVGQSAFAALIKRLYGSACCFPGCEVRDPRFLVGAHIARWSDNELLRGDPGNGLCFCLLHDRAFELGMFTLDGQFRIFVNLREAKSQSGLMQGVFAQQGRQIRLADTLPLTVALREHWNRVNLTPPDGPVPT